MRQQPFLSTLTSEAQETSDFQVKSFLTIQEIQEYTTEGTQECIQLKALILQIRKMWPNVFMTCLSYIVIILLEAHAQIYA